MEKTRIAILGAQGIPKQYGGFETFAEELATRLVAKGYQVTVFCEKNEHCIPEEYRGVNLEYVAAPPLGPLRTIIYDMLSLVRARNYDIVYMLGYGSSFFCFVPRLFGGQVWINMDGIEWQRKKWNAIARLWLRMMEKTATYTANRIIADADAVLDHLKQRHRRLPHHSVIAYGAEIPQQAPDISLLESWSVLPGQYYIMVGRLEPENHILEILQGFAASDTPYPLLVLGNHHADTAYVKQLKQVRDERIRFVGTVFDNNRLQSLRHYAIAYFHGHSVGGTNPSLLEALGCGNPVIAHDNPFNREVAKNAALYFTHSAEIPNKIEQLEDNSALRLSMSETGMRIIHQDYQWDSIVDQYLLLIQQQEATVKALEFQ